MKLAISNIAWPPHWDAAVAELLLTRGITGIEIAPSKVWPNPETATDSQIDAYRDSWAKQGIEIVAAQALLYGHPELTIFESATIRNETLGYLGKIIRICAHVGAMSLVFGSPKNRRIGHTTPAEAQAIAVDFFSTLATTAVDCGTTIVLEANPTIYGADFVTRASEAIDLVRAVAHPGLRLHLDTACMHLAGDSIAATFDTGFELLNHFHVSEPNLDSLAISQAVHHRAFAQELISRGYSGWVSLEMREPLPFTLDALARSLDRFCEAYAEPAATLNTTG